MNTYNPGDPVWARASRLLPVGEHAAVVIERLDHFLSGCCGGVGYTLDVLNYPCSVPGKHWWACLCRLRPRRDDYQQHEPLGTRQDLGVDFRKECELEAEEA